MSGSLYQYGMDQAAQYGVPQNLFSDIINAESGWNPNVGNSSTGATGIAQFLPSTAANAGFGVTPFDPSNPQASLTGAAQYLSGLYNKYGSWNSAVNYYNTGNPNGNGYPGNASIANDLSQLSGTSSPTAAASGNASPQTQSTSAQSCGYDATCWLKALGSWLGKYASRAALIVLAVILLIGAAYLFATRTQEVINAPA